MAAVVTLTVIVYGDFSFCSRAFKLIGQLSKMDCQNAESGKGCC